MQEAPPLLWGCSHPPGQGQGSWGPSIPQTYPFAGQEPSGTAGSSRQNGEAVHVAAAPALLHQQIANTAADTRRPLLRQGRQQMRLPPSPPRGHGPSEGSQRCW